MALKLIKNNIVSGCENYAIYPTVLTEKDLGLTDSRCQPWYDWCDGSQVSQGHVNVRWVMHCKFDDVSERIECLAQYPSNLPIVNNNQVVTVVAFIPCERVQ